ncbi:oligopeptidase B Serine peptidase. MEROPS family S09A [Granulicella pectinivorans]|uniref:Oligopeptidase B Serine peptidase. MEROPS family S09A n=1 Tax=Granulicella pectinivorans TaxID=474950 RepID=A0A1I6MIX4_9BACT|nr:S9 family peptidase [Granulicella pectinivorans]SFS15660.1 oligopeptidase B Serine peptidase. MEROPS family S09A [Granulicella pectinivorans]
MQSDLKAPVARRDTKSVAIHGTELVDDFGWMREKASPEVIDYLNAENAYTEAAMAGTKDLQAKLYAEMLSHIKETDESVPYRKNGWWYSSRTVEGLQYPIHCRRTAPDAEEIVILDVNTLAEGQAFMAVGDMAISPDGWLLAYSTDNTGFRQYTLHVRDLRTGEDLPDTAVRVGSVAWAADGKTLFYTTEDEGTKRHDRLFRHVLGGEPVQIHHEEDERFNLGVGKTRDAKYLLMEAGSHTTSECHFLAADTPEGTFTLIAPRVDDQEYSVDHRDGLFYIRVNDTGENFRIVTAEVTNPGRDHWTEFLPEDKTVPLEDFDVFQTFLVTSTRREGLPVLKVYPLLKGPKLGEAKAIAFPEPTYTAGGHANPEMETTKYRYSYQSLVSPASVYEYDVASGTSTLLKQQEVPGGFDASLYASERVWVTAEDGVHVPVSVVYRRESFRRDGTNPLYVYGYGSYGYALPVGFGATRLSLLDRGVVIAYAHIRGGGEMGDAWHDAGKMMVKRTTFTDFIRATEHLVAEGYGAKDRVAIEGGSAGGLLMGAVVNMRPDLFRVVLSHVPFVDVMNTMLDASLPLTVAEYEEWGNPNEPEAYAYMRSYSPYDNLAAGPYPSMLVKTSLNDSQVMYWEPAKYVARLRGLKTNDTPLLLHINMDAGHGGASGRYDYLKEIAFDYAFLLIQLGVEGAETKF